MEQTVESFLTWIQFHPHWAGVIVFLICTLESLLVVGLLIPATVIMFGIGAMIATGQMEFLPTLFWAATGSITGDGASYLIGRHYQQRLRVIWPFNRYPKMMAHGVDFFHRHGGKSVLFARFVGPVRPLVPAVAGMLGMPAKRFFTVAIFAACLWAPAYLLPGIILGASLGIVAQTAGRLALFLGLLIALLWFSWWLIRKLSRLLQPRTRIIQAQVLNWSRQHISLKPLAEALLDPEHPEARGMTVLTLLLLAASWVFLTLTPYPSPISLLGNLDLYLFNHLQTLRNPWGDQIMLVITRIASAPMLAIFTVLVSCWLIWTKHWQAITHWLITIVCVSGLTFGVKEATAISRPIELLNRELGFSFPSGHASLSMATFGFLAVLVARETAINWRWLPYTLAGLLVVMISFSRLYLGAHWLSDVVGGLSLGIAWVALMGIAYRSHFRKPIAMNALLPVIFLSFLVIALLGNRTPVNTDLASYSTTTAIQSLSKPQWLQSDWQRLPAFRNDLQAQHNHPMNVQWSADLKQIDKLLDQMDGWKPTQRLAASTLFELFETNPEIDALPVFPQIHQGKNPKLVRYKLTPDPNKILVLRIWGSSFTVDGNPVWAGNIGYMTKQPLHLLTVLAMDTNFVAPMEMFLQELSSLNSLEKPGLKQTVALSGSEPLLLLFSSDTSE